jgi:hypothetical protein
MGRPILAWRGAPREHSTELRSKVYVASGAFPTSDGFRSGICGLLLRPKENTAKETAIQHDFSIFSHTSSTWVVQVFNIMSASSR